jgi:lysozyme
LERIMSRLTASRAAFDLIASFEGFRTRAVAAPNGKWTLGFGHVATAREGLSVTRAEAEDLLRWDLLPIEDTIRQVALTPLSQNQFDALLSFAFNIGLEKFKGSDVLKYLNQGQPIAAALSMHAWRRARLNGRVLTIDALVRRRAAEVALFLEPVGARAAAPTSIIAPELDQSAILTLVEVEGPEESKTETENGKVANKIVEPTQSPIDPKVDVPPKPVAVASPIGEKVIDKPSQEALLPLPPKALSVAQTSVQDIVREPGASERYPTTAPSLAPLSPPKPASPPPPLAPDPKLKAGPILPNGIAPFPSGPVFNTSTPAANANGNGETQSPQNLPANDGYNTRLYSAAEMVDEPPEVTASKPKPKAQMQSVDSFTLMMWALMALGAALLAFGLFYGWRSGLLSVASQKREPKAGELSALLAAGSGFMMLVTGAIAAITSSGKSQDA